jgi:hypothetical protein
MKQQLSLFSLPPDNRPSRKVLLRRAALAYLGNRCSNPNCRWMNNDGSFGCADLDMLHIDHVNRDGAKERRNLSDLMIYRRVLEDTEGRYRILCANCNWKKRQVDREFYHPPHTPEAKAKIGKGRKGWKHTEESKRMMSESAKKRGKLAWSTATRPRKDT